jgi:hypothetical protein
MMRGQEFGHLHGRSVFTAVLHAFHVHFTVSHENELSAWKRCNLDGQGGTRWR